MPSAIAVAADSMTQVGTSSAGLRFPLATSARKMIPIVFCASFVPWESEKRLPVMIWPRRNPRVTGPGWRRPTIR